MFDGVEFGREIVAATKGYVEKAVMPLAARLDALENAPPEVDGLDLDYLKKEIRTLQEAIAAIPAPPAVDGAAIVAPLVGRLDVVEQQLAQPPEVDGLDLDYLKKEIRTLQEAIAAIPAPPAVDGAAIVAPLVGRLDVVEQQLAQPPEVDVDDLQFLKSGLQSLESAIAAIPPPAEPKGIDEVVLAGLVEEKVTTALAGFSMPDLTLPEELCASVALAIRTMAETPDVVVPPQDQRGVAPMHVHLPEIVLPELKYPDQAIHVAAPVVNIAPPIVSVPAPEKRRTRTVVKAHDAAGRITEFEQEEI